MIIQLNNKSTHNTFEFKLCSAYLIFLQKDTFLPVKDNRLLLKVASRVNLCLYGSPGQDLSDHILSTKTISSLHIDT